MKGRSQQLKRTIRESCGATADVTVAAHSGVRAIPVTRLHGRPGFLLLRFFLSILGSSRLRRTIQHITDIELLRTIAEQCGRVGLKRVPLVALCQRVSVPVVVGIVKPMILLPPALCVVSIRIRSRNSLSRDGSHSALRFNPEFSAACG